MSALKNSNQESSEGGLGLFVGLVPWVVFTVLAEHANLKLGAAAALVAAVLVALPGIKARKPKVLELGAVATFAGFLAVAFAVDAAVAHDVARYARGIAAGALSLIAFASLLYVPFTEQYAREKVPAAAWTSPQFKAINRRLTAMWGMIFAAMVPFHVAAGVIDTQRGNIVLNWIVPGLLVLWGVKRSAAAGDENAAPVAPVAA